MVLVVVLYALLAATFIFAKKVTAYANPCFIIGFRMLTAGAVLIGYQLWRQRAWPAIRREDWILFLKVALVHIYIPFITEFWSLQYLSALKVTMIYSATPFVAAVLSYFLLSERLSGKKILGITIGFAGIIPVVVAASSTAEAAMEKWGVSIPELALMISVVSAAYAWFLVKDLMGKGYGLGTINGVAMLGGGVLGMITAAMFEGFGNAVYHWPSFLLWVGLLIFVANVIVYNLYGWLLRFYSITFVTFAGFLCPSFGMLYEWLFMRTAITWHYFASLALVTFGLYVFYRGEVQVEKT